MEKPIEAVQVTERELSRKPMRILVVGFIISVIVLALFSLISFIQIRREKAVSDWIIRSFTLKLKVRESLSLLNFAQSQHRAFLLTSDSNFYHSYKRSVAGQKLANRQLDSLIGGYSNAQLINLGEFKRLSEKRRLHMDMVLDSARVLTATLLTPMLMVGAHIMDSLNGQIRKIELEEDAHLQMRLGQKDRREGNMSAWMLGFSIIALVTIVLSFFILRKQRFRLSRAELNKIYLEAEIQQRIREISDANRELLEKNTELKSRNAELNHFAFISGHDMKEPLRKTRTFLKLILETDGEKLSAVSKEYASRIFASVDHMANLIDAILIYMKSAWKKKKEQVDLNEVVEGVKNELKPFIDKKSATIHYDRLPVLTATPEQIERLVYALVSNSLKFSRGEPVIQITCAADIVEGQPFWKIEFTDNGIGFDMKYSDKIFTIFQRLHSRDEYPGTGLGLALAKRIVENHGGTISVNSEPGKGSTFTILLPKG